MSDFQDNNAIIANLSDLADKVDTIDKNTSTISSKVDTVEKCVNGITFYPCTQDEYDGMSSHDANTLYIIKEG